MIYFFLILFCFGVICMSLIDLRRIHVQVLKEYNVVALVRACESSYSTDLLEKEGITVHDLVFEDGSVPSPVRKRHECVCVCVFTYM
jgi:hypothetical protein